VIIDLRDYRMAPGMRERLIERLEGVMLDEQERLGATWLGILADADDPDRLVFLRGVPDLAARQRMMTAFYGEGALWKANRAEVNTWLADTDDVLLMRPISAWGRAADGPSIVGMYSHVGRAPLGDAAAAALRRDVEAAVEAAGGRMLVTLATDPAENNYPDQPIRTGEHGLVWLATFAGEPRVTLPSVTRRRFRPTARSRIR
jgi:hypothetical protein